MSTKKIKYKYKPDRQLSPEKRAAKRLANRLAQEAKRTADQESLVIAPPAAESKTYPIIREDALIKPEYPEAMLKPVHVDEFLDEVVHYAGHPELNYVAFMLNYFRMPAVIKLGARHFMQQFRLFVTFEGARWRVTGASRLGDVWLTQNFEQSEGYSRRVDFDLSKLTDWNSRP